MKTIFFFTPLFCCCFWIRDPRSGIRDKHPGIPQHCLQGKDRPLYENEKLANFCLVAVIGNRQGQKNSEEETMVVVWIRIRYNFTGSEFGSGSDLIYQKIFQMLKMSCGCPIMPIIYLTCFTV